MPGCLVRHEHRAQVHPQGPQVRVQRVVVLPGVPDTLGVVRPGESTESVDFSPAASLCLVTLGALPVAVVRLKHAIHG
jgi:hypothetical protein